MDDNMRLVLDADIAAGNRVFPIFLRFPEMFPFSPPSVFPRGDDKTRWSALQFGPNGELCLEFGPDNWTPEMTGVQLMESAHKLLSLENPSEGEPSVVASRHVETLGQQLRLSYVRFLVTRELAAFFESAPTNTAITGNLIHCYHTKGSTYVLNAVTLPQELAWSDPGVPQPLVDEGRERQVPIFKINATAPLPTTADLPLFKSSVRASLGFEGHVQTSRRLLSLRDQRFTSISCGRKTSRSRSGIFYRRKSFMRDSMSRMAC